MSASCPFFPSKQTFISAICTSALCHKQTLAKRRARPTTAKVFQRYFTSVTGSLVR